MYIFVRANENVPMIFELEMLIICRWRSNINKFSKQSQKYSEGNSDLEGGLYAPLLCPDDIRYSAIHFIIPMTRY